jgi:TetR/AcrR family transcriptional regulator, transcriptional repressor for nem operon
LVLWKKQMEKGNITKLKIVQCAAPIFNQRGYAGASMADVMQATGLKKGGIYNHFESKEQLALEAFRYAVALSRQRYHESLSGHDSSLEQLSAFIAVFQRVYDDPPVPGGCPLLNTAIDSDDAFPMLQRETSREMQLWHRWIVRIIRRGVNRGEIQAEIDAKAVATLLIASLEGGLMLSKLHQDPLFLAQVAEYLKSYLVSHLQP